jgi:DNA-directed RNA polymerase I, II, and III subunit RPABC4
MDLTTPPGLAPRVLTANINFQPNQPREVIDCSSSSVVVWRDFKTVLLDQLNMRTMMGYSENDLAVRVTGGEADDDDYLLQDDEVIDFESMTEVDVTEEQMTLRVLHNGEVTEVLVPTTATLQPVREQLQSAESEAMAKPLTFMGRVVPEKDQDERPFRMRAMGVQNGSILVGERQIDITDDDAMDNVVMSVTDDKTVGDLLMTYINKKQRVMVQGSYLSAERHNMDRPENLHTLYNVVESNEDNEEKKLGTTEKLYFNFHAGQFEVSVQEEGHDAIAIGVYDYWTVQQLKEAYTKNEMAYEGLMEQDKLIFGHIYLDELNTLYEHKVQPDAVLTIEREDIHQITTAYLCGDCGLDVMLKPQDVVRCRKCGHRIVYKKRTEIPVQFLAR